MGWLFWTAAPSAWLGAPVSQGRGRGEAARESGRGGAEPPRPVGFVVIPRWSFCWGTPSAPRWGRAWVSGGRRLRV